MVAVSGTSAAFNGRGERLGWLAAGETGTFNVTVPLLATTTPYVRFGDWVVALAAAVVVIAGTTALLGRCRRGPGSP
jgi:apolipoprotein N-acyltransferase